MKNALQNVVKHKIGLLNLATEIGNVSRACKVMGFPRDTFYRYQLVLASGCADALNDANRNRPNLRNLVEGTTVTALAASALEQPLVRFVFPTNYASAAYSSRPLACG
jgi:hypothetical protein